MSDAYRAAQGLLAAQPRFALAHLPTPLERLACSIPGLAGSLWVKRDDCTGLAMGGNKSRKLEFTIGDALAKGATALVTASGVQSNHVRQTAAAARRAGLSFHAVVAPALPTFPRDHVDSGNVLLDMLFGARLHLVDSEADVGARMAAVIQSLRDAGERPYLIPLGASDGIGSLGYVAAAWELLDQLRAQNIAPSHIFLPTGSGGTHGGLLAGLRVAGSMVPVIGISVSEPTAAKVAKVRASIDGVGAILPGVNVGDDQIIVHDQYAGDGYAHPTDQADNWVRRVALSDGLLLDTVYTGKAFAGMADLIAQGRLGAVGDVVFLHTGGTPALFANPRQLKQAEADAAELAPLYDRIMD